MENVSFLNADELVFLDESLTGNAMEVFEGGRLKGFSTHTFTPGQVIKVFGRRVSPATTMTSSGTMMIATPPAAPPTSHLLISSPPTLLHPHQQHMINNNSFNLSASGTPPQQLMNSGYITTIFPLLLCSFPFRVYRRFFHSNHVIPVIHSSTTCNLCYITSVCFDFSNSLIIPSFYDDYMC